MRRQASSGVCRRLPIPMGFGVERAGFMGRLPYNHMKLLCIFSRSLGIALAFLLHYFMEGQTARTGCARRNIEEPWPNDLVPI